MNSEFRGLQREAFDHAPRHFHQVEDTVGRTIATGHRLINGVAYDFELPFELVRALEQARTTGKRIRVFDGYTKSYLSRENIRMPSDCYEGKPFPKAEHGILELEHAEGLPWDI